MNPSLAIIGGSGLYSIPGLQKTKELDLETPFGKPSAPVVVGELEGQPVASWPAMESDTISRPARSITAPTSMP